MKSSTKQQQRYHFTPILRKTQLFIYMHLEQVISSTTIQLSTNSYTQIYHYNKSTNFNN